MSIANLRPCYCHLFLHHLPASLMCVITKQTLNELLHETSGTFYKHLWCACVPMYVSVCLSVCLFYCPYIYFCKPYRQFHFLSPVNLLRLEKIVSFSFLELFWEFCKIGRKFCVVKFSLILSFWILQKNKTLYDLRSSF